MAEGQLIGTYGQCLQLCHVDGSRTIEDSLCTTRTGVDVQTSCVGCRRCCRNGVLALWLYGEGSPHGVTVVLASLNGVSTFTELGAPGTGTYLTVVEPDVGIVLYIHGHLTEVAAHILHGDVHHLGLLAVVEGYDDGVLTLVDAILGNDGMTAVVHIAVIDRRLSYILTVDGDVGLCLRGGDGHITTNTDVKQHLVSTSALH